MKGGSSLGNAVAPHGPPVVTFWGAAGSVSGSMHLAETAGGLLLLDCGLSFERRHLRTFPFPPQRLRAVVLTHAHLDHSGNLPNLVRQGYNGPVFCTPATRDLLAVMLADSARIQEEDARRAAHREPWDHALPEPLYLLEDVERTLDQCIPIDYDEAFTPVPGVEAWLRPAGHVLGSAQVHLRTQWEGRTTTLTYTGDLGRSVLPLHQPPALVPAADLVLCESTYGGGHHEPLADMLSQLRDLVRQTLEREGKVYIPAFSLGRTQLMAWLLLDMMRSGSIPTCPLLIDSPLAARITTIYRQHFHELGAAVRAACGDESRRFLSAPHLRFVADVEESRELNAWPGPGILVASSGMGDGGRIVHHLYHGIEDPRNTVILVSFQAPGTLGARLLEAGPTVRLLGRQVNKWADVVQLRGFSAHADQSELLASLGDVLAAPRQIALVHGERVQSEALAEALRGAGAAQVSVAGAGQRCAWPESTDAVPAA
ncbi:MAG TPA: MBL fold metallo-hydrolase [Gemmatales bacterium]|nr:MBL fold metallo-hydrolase [Gemmatales bacterium]HMP60332.1 MBL fold metallo-hydrolase [Gemmatales bacterium]